MTDRVRRRRISLASDQGIGLPEMVISMFLLGILMTIVVSVFISFTDSFTSDRASTDSTNVASTGMNEVTRVIRSGTENAVKNQYPNDPVFQVATPNEVMMFAYLDTESASPEPIKVRFFIDAATSELTETRWGAKPLGDGYFTFKADKQSERVVARKIVPPAQGGATLFRFFRADGSEITVPPAGIPVTSLRDIVAVEIAMTVQADITGETAPVTIKNRVGIPNLGISRVGL